MPTQKISFLKGLDKDSDIRYLQNAYRDAYNVRITDYKSGNKLTIVNAKGNTEKEYSLPSGHNFVIGSFDDKVNKNVYYFVFNNENNHSILKYDYKLDVVSEVLTGLGLGFTEENKITSVALLDNRFLIYTDNNKEPRQVDLDNISKYGSPYSSSTGLLLDIAKASQELPCLVSYNTNSDKKYNNLIGNFWQFRTLYVYKDGTRSSFSTISKCPIPTVDAQKDYSEGQDVSADNELIVSIPYPPEDVDKVEVYSQGVNNDSVKTSNWYLFNTLLRQEVLDAPISEVNYGNVVFSNDGIYTLADPVEVSQAQTFIPKRAKALDIIHGNRLALANVTEGEDVSDITLDASLTFIENEVPSVPAFPFEGIYQNDVGTESGAVKTNSNYRISISSATQNTISVDPVFDQITQSSPAGAGDIITLALKLNYQTYRDDGFSIGSSTRTINYTIHISYTDIVSGNPSQTEENVLKKIANAINSVDSRDLDWNTGGIVAVYAESTFKSVKIYQKHNTIQGVNNYTSVTSVNINPSGSKVTATNNTRLPSRTTFKREAIHEFGIEYRDSKGRRSSIIASPSLKKISPEYSTSTVNGGRVTAKVEISSNPPSWAESYSLMYSKNQSFDYTLSFVGVIEWDTAEQNWRIGLVQSTANPYLDFRTKYEDTPIGYTYSNGDLLKIIYSIGGTSVFDKIDAIPILKYGSDGYIRFSLDAPPSDGGLMTDITDGSTYVFEIRRPKKNIENKFFYEIGKTFPIEGGFHQGDSQNQNSGQPAVIDLNEVGDYYYVYRNYYNDYGTPSQITIFGESKDVSDYYDSEVTSIGRANVVDDNFKEINKFSLVTYSQPYIPESNINGIGTFYGTSIEQYATQYGSIQHIHSEGRRLFLFQENKIGQIGVNEQFFLDGSQQTYQTSTVLNPAQYYPAEYGIGTNPESFSVFGYRKYFIDSLRGAVIRLSQDGMTPISNSGMRGIFNEILSSPNGYLKNLTYNEAFDELTASFTPTKIPVSDIGIIISQTPLVFSINKSLIPVITSSDVGVAYYDNGTKSNFNIAALSEGASTYNVTTDLVIPSASLNYIEIGNYNVITYSEEAGAWVSKWDYKPEWLEECGIGMVSFNEGKIYLHDSNNSRGQFYGTNYPAKVKVVANENPSHPKLLKTIQQESTTQWECPSISTLEGQESNLIDDDFQNIQNQWYAAFLFDSNTPNVTDPLINGDPLRSAATEIQLQNDSTSEEKLFSVGVNYIVSNLSNDE